MVGPSNPVAAESPVEFCKAGQMDTPASSSNGLRRFRAAEERLWASRSLAPRERFVQLRNGARIRVQEVGEGPPMVFIHGATNGGASWAPLFAHLEGVRAIAIDRPGCGLSEPVGGPQGFRSLDEVERYTDQLLIDVLDALDLDQAAVGATSYGGLFAFRGAAAHPDRVTRIVEYSWSMGAPMDKVPMMIRIGAIRGMDRMTAKIPPTRGAVRMMLRQIGLRGALASGRFDDVMLDWFVTLLRETDTMENELRTAPRLFRPIVGLDPDVVLSAELLSRVVAPVLFLWGTDDPNGGEGVARRFAAQFPDAEVQLLDGAGHSPWVDEPETCALRTLEFLGS